MPKYGSAFSATDPLRLAPGTSHNAAVRGHRNMFNFAVDGGVLDSLLIAKVGPGNVMDYFKFETSANLSLINFTIGTLAVPAKYAIAFAGPNNTTLIVQPLLALGLAVTDAEDIYLFPSAALPAVGLLRTTVATTHR